MRQSESPMIVERMWPTCIGLATFGAEKSTTTVRPAPMSGAPNLSSLSKALALAAKASGKMRKLMNPGPAMSAVAMPARSRWPIISWANARGFLPLCLARTIAALL